jgi:hypothetical protein
VQVRHHMWSVGQVREQEPRVDDVEPLHHGVAIEHVLPAELDVAESRRFGLFVRDRELGLVEIRADHGPVRCQPRQFHRDVAAAAAGVETACIR